MIIIIIPIFYIGDSLQMNTTEKKTIGKMIHLYCKDKHGTSHALCSSCAELNNYAQRKLTKCIFGEDKPTCQNCKAHCYSSEMRERIKEIMKYSGPRMLLHNPILATKHLIKGLRSPKKSYPRKHDSYSSKDNNLK